MCGHWVNMASGGPHLVDELESAFQVCLSSLTKQEHIGTNDPDEIKTTVELSIQKFLDAAKQLETFFLQKSLILSTHKPEQIITEDIKELKQEIQRKDVLIQKHHDKLQKWQNMLSRTGSSQSSGLTQPGQNVVPPAQQPPPPQPVPQMQQMQQQQPHPTPQTPPVSQPMPPPHSAHPQYPQGPLAFLEQTTSNIGMPDGRR